MEVTRNLLLIVLFYILIRVLMQCSSEVIPIVLNSYLFLPNLECFMSVTMSINRFYHISNLNVFLIAKYANQMKFSILLTKNKETTLKWIRSMITGYYLFVAYYGLFMLDFNSISHPMWRNLKNHWWKCITVWNVALQVRYFILSFLIDHKDNLPKTTAVQKLVHIGKHVQDYCFITLDVPSAIFVCSLFWLIQGLNKSLLFPNEMSRWIPSWYNHAVHTNPFFIIFFQMFFHFHRNPPVKPAILGLWVHCTTYFTCVLYTRWSTGQWIYLFIGEILQDMPLAIFLSIIAGFIFPLTILLICYKLNDLIWKEKIY